MERSERCSELHQERSLPVGPSRRPAYSAPAGPPSRARLRCVRGSDVAEPGHIKIRGANEHRSGRGDGAGPGTPQTDRGGDRCRTGLAGGIRCRRERAMRAAGPFPDPVWPVLSAVGRVLRIAGRPEAAYQSGPKLSFSLVGVANQRVTDESPTPTEVTNMPAHTRHSARLGCELLEAREVPTVSFDHRHLNKAPIPVGDTLWFSSFGHVQAPADRPVHGSG